MTHADLSPALMSAQVLPAFTGESSAPDWIHLLPAGDGGRIDTDDARGPYHVIDPEKIITASFGYDSKLPIDENHATDLAAKRGEPAPARGWIVEMQAREDGIWGRVEWTEAGAALVSSKAYRGISPVILPDKSKQIHAILRASLVNKPNLRGMASLHQTQDSEMSFRTTLIEMLDLNDAATDDEIMAALKAKNGDGGTPALQSAVSEIGVALGLNEGAEISAIISAAKAASVDDGKDGLIIELQSSVKDLSDRLTELRDENSLAASEAFYETALSQRRAGVGPKSRDHLISLHQKDPEAAIAFVSGMPRLDETATTLEAPAPKDGEVHLNATERQVAALIGMSETDFADQAKKLGERA